MRDSAEQHPFAHSGEGALPVAAPRQSLVVPYRLLLLFIFFSYAVQILIEMVPLVRMLNPIQVLVLASGGSLLIEKTLRREPFLVPWPEWHALLFFLAAGVVSAANSFWPGLTIFNVFELAKGIFVCLLLVNVINSASRLRALYWSFTCGIAAVAVGTLWYYSQGIVDEGRAMYAGQFANSNDLAMVIVTVMPLALSLLAGARPVARLFIAVTLALSAVAFFLTFSRGGIVGLAFAITTLLIRSNSPRLRAWLIFAIVAAMALFPVYSVFWTRDVGLNVSAEDATFENRLVSVQVGFAMFMDAPILGLGFGASAIGFSEYAPDDYLHESAIHNTLALLVAETGMVGAILWLTAFFVALVRVDRIARGSAGSVDAPSPRQEEVRSYAVALESSMFGFLACSMAGPYLLFWIPYYFVAMSSILGRVAASPEPAPAR